MNRIQDSRRWWGGRGAGRRQDRLRLRPDLLTLEGRQLLATIDVTNTHASGAGSLAAAIKQANGDDQANTIAFTAATFNTLQTITLGGSELELSDTGGKQTIDGPAAGVAINAGGQSRVFQVDSGVHARISGLTIEGGSVAGGGGGLLNYGTIDLVDCTISGDRAEPTPAHKFSYNNALGGGVDNLGTATLDNCTITKNSAYNYGGGLYNDGTLTVDDCSISGNRAAAGGGLESVGGTATLDDCTIQDNREFTGVHGGGWSARERHGHSRHSRRLHHQRQ
jgi:hypothetical protein